MAIVKSDIGGNITVRKCFCNITIILILVVVYLPFFFAGK
jgi:hypothetical protein